MAKRKISSKEEIVFEKHFQNTFKTVDIVLYKKDKPKSETQKPSNKFIRKCEIIENLNKMGDSAHKENICKSDNNKISKHHQKKISKTKSKKFDKNITWEEVLQKNCLSRTQDKSKKDSNYSNCESNRNDHAIAKEKRPQRYPKKYVSNRTNVGFDYTDHTEYKGIKTISDNIKKKVSVPMNVAASYRNQNEDFKPVTEEQVENQSLIMQHRNMNNEETHSPFGASALQILQLLRIRLRSNEDNEGMEMVSEIESKISGLKSVGNMAAYKRTPSAETNYSPYPPVFLTHQDIQLEEDYKKQSLKLSQQAAEIKDNQEIIQTQSSKIEELTELAKKLLEYHQKAINEPDPPKKDDSKVEELRLSGERLSVENEKMKLEMKNYIDTIRDMEVKLAKANQQIESLSRNSSPYSNICGNKSTAGEVNSREKFSKETDPDSAFDDKTASRSTSRSSVNPVRVSCQPKAYNTYHQIAQSIDATGEYLSRDITFEEGLSRHFQSEILPKQSDHSMVRAVGEINVDYEFPDTLHFNYLMSQRGHENPQKNLESTRSTKYTTVERSNPSIMPDDTESRIAVQPQNISHSNDSLL